MIKKLNPQDLCYDKSCLKGLLLWANEEKTTEKITINFPNGYSPIVITNPCYYSILFYDIGSDSYVNINMNQDDYKRLVKPLQSFNGRKYLCVYLWNIEGREISFLGQPAYVFDARPIRFLNLDEVKNLKNHKDIIKQFKK